MQFLYSLELEAAVFYVGEPSK